MKVSEAAGEDVEAAGGESAETHVERDGAGVNP